MIVVQNLIWLIIPLMRVTLDASFSFPFHARRIIRPKLAISLYVGESCRFWILPSVHKTSYVEGHVYVTQWGKKGHMKLGIYMVIRSMFFFLFFFISLVYVPLCLAAPSSNKHSPNPVGCDNHIMLVRYVAINTITNAADHRLPFSILLYFW